MLEIFFISIGLVLVIEGIFYYFIADKIHLLLTKLEYFKPQKIKNISFCIVIIGLCLIYFTIKYYAETK